MTGAPDAHPRHRLDPVLTAGVRLSVMAALDAVDDAEFGVLRDAVETTDSVLSKQISSLEEVGYVRVEKGYAGRRPRTWIAATALGRSALRAHAQALRDLLRSL